MAAVFNALILLSLFFLILDLKHRFWRGQVPPEQSWWWIAALLTSVLAAGGILLRGPDLADYLRSRLIVLRVWLWCSGLGLVTSAGILALGAVQSVRLERDFSGITFGAFLGLLAIGLGWVGARLLGRGVSSAREISGLLARDPHAFFLRIRQIDNLALLGLIKLVIARFVGPRTHPFRSMAAARVFLVLAVVVLFGPPVLFIALTGFGDPPLATQHDLRGIGFLIIVASVLGAFALERAAASLRTQDASALLADDTRSPVLYLRSFVVEGVHTSKYEDVLRQFFSGIGPLVAVGRPGELFQTAGAARLYPGDAWQEVVTDLIQRAALVFVQIGATEGLAWEIATLLGMVDPRRVVVILRAPQSKWRRRHLIAEYSQFRESLGALFPRPLPASIGERGSFRLDWQAEPIGVGRFMCFGPDWEPHVIAIRTPSFLLWLRIRFGGNSPALALRACLEPTLERLGLTVPRLPLRATEVLHMALAITATLFAVAGVVLVAGLIVAGILVLLLS